MTTALGGPGVACSAMRIRRLSAGELSGEERARTEAHLAACARCQAVRREVDLERARVEAELPFETLAAGVAERLARDAAPRRRRRRPWAGLAVLLAAGLAAALAAPVIRRAAQGEADLGTRLKGGAELTVWVRDGGGARLLAPGEPVPPGAALRVGVAGARRFAAVALVDRDGAVVLHSGPLEAGPLPGAFEWTGGGEGTLVAVLADAPVDAAALADRLTRGGPGAAAPGPGAEVLVRPLRRGPP